MKITPALMERDAAGYYVQRVKPVRSKRRGVNIARRQRLTSMFKRHSGWKVPTPNRV